VLRYSVVESLTVMLVLGAGVTASMDVIHMDSLQ
jgi:hypothetical protein